MTSEVDRRHEKTGAGIWRRIYGADFFNRFPIICIFYILYNTQNREPA